MKDGERKRTNEERIIKPKVIRLIEENPDLPVIPVISEEVVASDEYHWWLGEWGDAEIKEYYLGRENFHIKDYDDEEEVLSDLVGCENYCDPQGRDITELSDSEWTNLYNSVPWIKAIVVYITV